jgi:hypothetical protein
MKNYDTVSEAVNDLAQLGYTFNFTIAGYCIACDEKGVSLLPADFEIDAVYRFEGDTDPADATVVYAISARQGDVKGLVVNAYGIYADGVSDELVAKLSVR